MILGFTILVGILLHIFERRGGDKIRREAAPADEDMIAIDEHSDAGVSSAEADTSDVNSDAEDEAAGGDNQEGEVCCGMHLVCEKTSLSPVSSDVEYFDDEELDRFRGRDAEDYSDAEIDEFLDVLLTMHPGEVASWSKSLQLRSIVPPTVVRDQILLIVGEQRIAENKG